MTRDILVDLPPVSFGDNINNIRNNDASNDENTHCTVLIEMIILINSILT